VLLLQKCNVAISVGFTVAEVDTGADITAHFAQSQYNISPAAPFAILVPVAVALALVVSAAIAALMPKKRKTL
jgi:hypothetical protein